MKLSAIAALAAIPLSMFGVKGCTTWEAAGSISEAQIVAYEAHPPTVAQVEAEMKTYAITNADLKVIFPSDPPAWVSYGGGYCGQVDVISAIENHMTPIVPASCVNGRVV